jgi:methionine aminopeptidase
MTSEMNENGDTAKEARIRFTLFDVKNATTKELAKQIMQYIEEQRKLYPKKENTEDSSA